MLEDSGKVEGDAEKFDEAFDKTMTDVPFALRPKPKAAPKDRTENEKVLVELKAAHRSWDEHKKNIVACVEKGMKDEHVAPKLVEDLRAFIEQGQNKDALLSNHEVQAKNGKVWDESDAKAIRELVAQLKNDIDSSKKLIKKIDTITKKEE